MGKIHKFINRLIKRAETAGTQHDMTTGAASCPPGDPLKCIDGQLYRMRLRAGRWESFGPPLGDCTDEDD